MTLQSASRQCNLLTHLFYLAGGAHREQGVAPRHRGRPPRGRRERDRGDAVTATRTRRPRLTRNTSQIRDCSQIQFSRVLQNTLSPHLRTLLRFWQNNKTKNPTRDCRHLAGRVKRGVTRRVPREVKSNTYPRVCSREERVHPLPRSASLGLDATEVGELHTDVRGVEAEELVEVNPA